MLISRVAAGILFRNLWKLLELERGSESTCTNWAHFFAHPIQFVIAKNLVFKTILHPIPLTPLFSWTTFIIKNKKNCSFSLDFKAAWVSS